MDKLAITIGVGALIIFVGSLFVESRLAPFIGALILGIAIVYGIIRNKAAGQASREKAERATRRRKEDE